MNEIVRRYPVWPTTLAAQKPKGPEQGSHIHAGKSVQ